MNWALIISALEKHARMAQAAVDFAREKRRGQLFAESMYVLDEAQRALDHVKEEQKLLSGKNEFSKPQKNLK